MKKTMASLPPDFFQLFVDEAQVLLENLKTHRLEVVLVPAPNPHFSGHMVRCVVNRNPKWYRRIYRKNFKRHRLVAALERVVKKKPQGTRPLRLAWWEKLFWHPCVHCGGEFRLGFMLAAWKLWGAQGWLYLCPACGGETERQATWVMAGHQGFRMELAPGNQGRQGRQPGELEQLDLFNQEGGGVMKLANKPAFSVKPPEGWQGFLAESKKYMNYPACGRWKFWRGFPLALFTYLRLNLWHFLKGKIHRGAIRVEQAADPEGTMELRLGHLYRQAARITSPTKRFIMLNQIKKLAREHYKNRKAP